MSTPDLSAAALYADLRFRLPNLAAESSRALLAEVLELHAPHPACAGTIPERFGEGRCCMCWRGEPDRVFWGYLNDSPGKVEQHQHGVYDFCSVCPGVGYPCETVRLIMAEFPVVSTAAQEVGR